MAFLEGLARRPQRLIVLAFGAFFTLTLLTWLTLSPTGYNTVRQTWSSLPELGIGRHSPDRHGPFVGVGAGGNADASNVAEMYSWNPGKPSTPEEIMRWSHKGEDNTIYPPEFIPQVANQAPRAKAGFIVLVRNEEADQMAASMLDVEMRFNRKYGYPWIFLNNVPFTDKFKNRVRQATRSEIRFGLVPKEHWGYPSWIDQNKAAQVRQEMKAKKIIYGDSESYRHMCRFQSGFFFRHPLTQDLDYYWRVEPGTKLACDIDYDPFLYMQMNNKTYGFTMALHEYIDTIPTLWQTSYDFAKKHPEYIAKDNGLHFMTDEPERFMEPGYNLCHFWSNFEIADLRFWRSQAYLDYFDHLDKAGGFFYERWGDAPVHSIAAVLFLNRSRLHWFEDIGYYHVPWQHCPKDKAKYHETGRCSCDPNQSFTEEGYSCISPQWLRTTTEKPPAGYKY